MLLPFTFRWHHLHLVFIELQIEDVLDELLKYSSGKVILSSAVLTSCQKFHVHIGDAQPIVVYFNTE